MSQVAFSLKLMSTHFFGTGYWGQVAGGQRKCEAHDHRSYSVRTPCTASGHGTSPLRCVIAFSSKLMRLIKFNQVFLLFEEPASFSIPGDAVEHVATLKDRRSWNAGAFAEKYGLKLVGANFFVTQSQV